MKRSLDQLRSQVWSSRDAAIKALKRNGFAPRGADYELRETKPKMWMVQPIEQAEPDPVASDPVASVAPDAPVAPPAPPAPGTDLSPVPVDAGPYSLRILADHVRQTGAVAQALELSQRTAMPIDIIRPDGTIARTIDAAAVKAARRAARAGTARPRGAPAAPRTDTKMARAVALLDRPDGATAAELAAATGWPFAQRHANHVSRSTRRPVVKLGDQHWRLDNAKD